MRLAVTALIIRSGIYASEAYLRQTQIPNCRWRFDEQLFDPSYASPPYSLRYCYLKRDIILLQLHDRAGQQLLAERMFTYPYYERLSLAWRLDERRQASALTYGFEAGDDISLPPTLLDRMRARLP